MSISINLNKNFYKTDEAKSFNRTISSYGAPSFSESSIYGFSER